MICASPLWNNYKGLGYSHTTSVKDPLYKVDKITKKEAEELLLKDLDRIDKLINRYLEVTITQNQYDALVSLVYDAGIKSVVGAGMFDFINDQNFDGATQLFRQWTRYKREPIYQLIKSRKAEIALFKTPMEN